MRGSDLIARYIEPGPHHEGPDDARIVDHGVSVWALIGYLRVMDGDIDEVASDYDLSREAVEAAIACYLRHQQVIDAAILLRTIPVE